MDPARIEQRITSLVRELGQYFGHRTLWIDDAGVLLHTEPDVELEGTGWRYVATLMQPDADALTSAIVHALPQAPLSPLARPSMAAELIPATA